MKLDTNCVRFLLIIISLSSLISTARTSLKNKKSSTKATAGNIENNLKEFARIFTERPQGDLLSYNEWTEDDDKQKQFGQDILMIYKTLFPENERFQKGIITLDKIISDKLKIDPVVALNVTRHDNLISAFKKIILAHIENGLYFGKEANVVANFNKTNLESHKWPHPMAAAFAHGGRTLFLVNKPHFNNFIEYIFPKQNNLLTPRLAASHDIIVKNGKIKEIKQIIKNLRDIYENRVNKLTIHAGMNIPFGGFGNLWWGNSVYITNNGIGIIKNKTALDKFKKTVKILQHGHFYYRAKEFKKDDHYDAVLLGLEEESPGFRGMFAAHAHDWTNALFTPKHKVAGGLQFSKIKGINADQVPNNLGGRVVFFEEGIKKNLYEKIHNNLEEKLQKFTWWILLSSNLDEAQYFINNILKKENPTEDLKKFLGDNYNK